MNYCVVNFIRSASIALTFGEKLPIFDLIHQERKEYAEVTRIYGKNKPSIREIVKKER